MSLNIFQLLKQGTSLRRENLIRLSDLQQKIEVQSRPANHDFEQSGHFNLSDSQLSSDSELDEAARKKNHNIAEEQRIVLRRLNNLKVQGDNVPPLLSNFTKLIQKYALKESIVKQLGELGFKLPTPVQMQVLPALLEKRNVLATAPTGSGKTLAFAIPLLQNLEHQKKKIQAVVLAPFFELSEQIHHQMQRVGEGTGLKILSIAHLTDKQKERLRAGKAITADILITTPMAFINTFGSHQQLVADVEYVIMDECDKYFEESFLDQIKQILSYFQNGSPVYGLFSATIQHPVQELLHSELLEDAVRVQVGGKNNVLSKINQTLEYCSNEFGKLVELRNLMRQGRFVPPVLLFVQSKERAKELFFELRKILSEVMNCVNRVEYITADKSKQERDNILEKFQKGKIWALIATDLIARGIDFKGVNLVINYDFPTSMLTYIHRVGRTGRADRQGDAITFYSDEDKGQLRSLANLLKVSGCKVPEWIFELKVASKRTRKQLIKRPVSREAISLDPRKHEDPNWRKQLNMIDKRFLKKAKKQKEAQKDDDEGWQVVT